MIEIEFEIKTRRLMELITIPKICAGIYKNAPLRSWKKKLTNLVDEFGGRFQANTMSSKKWGKETVDNSFSSVLAHTNLEKDFVIKEINKSASDIFVAFLRTNQTSRDIKRVENSVSALVKRAYLKMSQKLKNSLHRRLRKGHDLYAIGTGQTIKAITAKMDKHK